MSEKVSHPLKKYIRPGADFKTCSGCGNGIIAQSTLRAVEKMNLDFNKMVFVSGIGCAGWIPSPDFNTDVLHVTHGRAVAHATGVKLSNPELTVVVFSGDGDLAAIGGNHFIHSARRNIDLNIICVNNKIYGMTSGQVAPTTPRDVKTTTTPYGNKERAFDLSKLAESAGASFVARWTTYQARNLTESIKRAFSKKGLSFIEVVSQCPVEYGKVVGMRDDPVAMMKEFREKSINVEEVQDFEKENLEDKIVVGEMIDKKDLPELTREMNKIRMEAKKNE